MYAVATPNATENDAPEIGAAEAVTATRPPLVSQQPASQPAEAVPTPTPTTALLLLGVLAVLPPAHAALLVAAPPRQGEDRA